MQEKVGSVSLGQDTFHQEGVLSARARHSYPSKSPSTETNHPLNQHGEVRSLTTGNCKNTYTRKRPFDSVTYKVFRKKSFHGHL